MKKYLFAIAVLAAVPLTTFAASVSWDFNVGTQVLQPLQSAWSAVVKGSYFQATSTTASIFPFASTTAVSATSLCLTGDCRTVWPSSGSGSGTVSTSSSEVDGRVPFWTSTAATPALLSGGSANFVWDNTNSRLGIGSSTPWAQLSVNPNGITGPSFAIGSSTVTNLVVTNGGLVGVNTSSPTALFDVEGGTSPIDGTPLSIKLISQNAKTGTSNVGGDVTVTAGNAYKITSGGAIGGNVNITAGNGFGVTGAVAAGRGGAVNITAGAGGAINRGGMTTLSGGMGGSTSGAGGAVSILGGIPIEGMGGAVSMSAGNGVSNSGTGNFNGGGFLANAGNGAGTGNGGDINFTAGNSGVTGGTGGSIYFQAGTGFGSVIGNVLLQTLTGGNVGVGTSTPGSLLSIGGSATGWNFYDNATTTKNGVGGINIKQGCFSINGTCLSSGGSTASTTLLADDNTWSGTNIFPSLSVNGAITMSGVGDLSASGELSSLTASFGGGNLTIDGTGSLTVNGNTNLSSLDVGGGSLTIDGVGRLVTTHSIEADSLTLDTGTCDGCVRGSIGQTAYIMSSNTAVGTSTIFIDTNSRVGIGSTTPWAKLSVHANSGDTATTLFAIASSTASATSTLFAVDNTGHVVTGSPKGSLSSCGSTNSLNGNDNSGSIMFTGTLVNTCTFNFAQAVPASQNVSCQVSGGDTTYTTAVTATSTTAVTFGMSTTLSAGTLYYHCDRNVKN